MASEQMLPIKHQGKAGLGGSKKKDRNGRASVSKSTLLKETSSQAEPRGGGQEQDEVPRHFQGQEHQDMSGLPAGTALEAFTDASAIERADRSLTQKAVDQVSQAGTRVATHWLNKALFPKRKKRSKMVHLRWWKTLVVKQMDCKTFVLELLSAIPARLYTVTALSPLLLDTHPKAQLGLQIANAVLLLVLMGMGLMQGRFSDENRWYLRHYFIWTIISHLAAFYFGSYSDLVEAGSHSIQALSICRNVQAVQAFPLWSVQLFDVERLRVEKLS